MHLYEHYKSSGQMRVEKLTSAVGMPISQLKNNVLFISSQTTYQED